jgi:hypothetical protein
MKFDLDIVQTVRNAYANRAEPEAVYTSARVLWYAVLSISTLIVVVSLCVGLWMFNNALAVTSAPIETNGPTTAATGPRIDTNTLQAALNSFTSRKDTYNTLQDAPASVPDPS